MRIQIHIRRRRGLTSITFTLGALALTPVAYAQRTSGGSWNALTFESNNPAEPICVIAGSPCIIARFAAVAVFTY